MILFGAASAWRRGAVFGGLASGVYVLQPGRSCWRPEHPRRWVPRRSGSVGALGRTWRPLAARGRWCLIGEGSGPLPTAGRGRPTAPRAFAAGPGLGARLGARSQGGAWAPDQRPPHLMGGPRAAAVVLGRPGPRVLGPPCAGRAAGDVRSTRGPRPPDRPFLDERRGHAAAAGKMVRTEVGGARPCATPDRRGKPESSRATWPRRTRAWQEFPYSLALRAPGAGRGRWIGHSLCARRRGPSASWGAVDRTIRWVFAEDPAATARPRVGVGGAKLSTACRWALALDTLNPSRLGRKHRRAILRKRAQPIYISGRASDRREIRCQPASWRPVPWPVGFGADDRAVRRPAGLLANELVGLGKPPAQASPNIPTSAG